MTTKNQMKIEDAVRASNSKEARLFTQFSVVE